jgi:predicted ester cyclase
VTHSSTELSADDMRRGHTLIVEDLPGSAAEWIHEDYLHHDPLTPETETVSNRAQYLTAYEAFKEAVPDQSTVAEHVIVEGNYSAARWRFTGTHTGAFRDLQPTNNSIDYAGMTMYRWDDGRVVEGWTLFDVMGFYAQIGLGVQQ